MGAKTQVIIAHSKAVTTDHKIIRFRGRPLVLLSDPYPHYVPMRRELFDALVYPILGGISRTTVSDVFAYLANTAPDYTHLQNYVLFGLPGDPEARVWDMDRLVFTQDVSPDAPVWRSPYAPGPTGRRTAFILDLAGGDHGLYDDIMQSLAPLVMDRKPDGVIWWVGDGANGKSTLMDAVYQLFPGQLSSITVKRLVDGRDTPSLNGTLGNIVKESSEGRVDDTEIYKAIGTHESFRVHRFHSQDDIEIQGNVHHIFSANLIPVFNDKGYASRRRTFIVPFTQKFESDPTFEEATFVPKLFSELVGAICEYAQVVKGQGYRYKWSAITRDAKALYDVEASNAEEYAREAIQEGVVGFDGFGSIRMDYENWCADNGYVPLGIGNLRRILRRLGFERTSSIVAGLKQNIYKLPSVSATELQALGMHRMGLFTVVGWQPRPQLDPKQPEPEPVEVKPVLRGNW